MTAHYRRARRRLDELAERDRRRDADPPAVVAAAVDRLAADDAVLLADVGTPLWAARYLPMNGRRRLIGSFVHGTMANALPQAIGVQAAYPGRQVITLSGDGGLAMLLGELLTLRQQQLPVKVVMFNNGALGVRRAGDEGRRHRELRHRPRQPRLRRGRPRRSASTASASTAPTTWTMRSRMSSPIRGRRWSTSKRCGTRSPSHPG